MEPETYYRVHKSTPSHNPPPVASVPNCINAAHTHTRSILILCSYPRLDHQSGRLWITSKMYHTFLIAVMHATFSTHLIILLFSRPNNVWCRVGSWTFTFYIFLLLHVTSSYKVPNIFFWAPPSQIPFSNTLLCTVVRKNVIYISEIIRGYLIKFERNVRTMIYGDNRSFLWGKPIVFPITRVEK
jgi:hypothetical protein